MSIVLERKERSDIVIKSEADAYEVLERATKGELGEYDNLVFDGWPTLSLYLKGKKFEQSITPTVMRGLLEMQRGIYHSYAAAKFDNPTRRLTEEEKDELEIKIRVDGGSSLFDINFTEIAKKLVEQLVTRMGPTEIVVMVLGIAVLYFGTSAYKAYLSDRKETRLKELTDETQRATLEVLKFSSEQETKRTAIIADLAKRDHRLSSIREIAHDVHTDVIKTLAVGDEAKLGEIPMSPVVATILTHNAKRKSSEVRLDGIYRLVKLDWSDPLSMRVKVENIETKKLFDAEVQDDSLTSSHKTAIQEAEWSREPIELQVNAKKLGEDDYRDIVIIGVKSISKTQSSM